MSENATIQTLVDAITRNTHEIVKNTRSGMRREMRPVLKYVTQATQVDAGDICHVPANRIMPIWGPFTVDGAMKVEGSVLLLDPAPDRVRPLGAYEEQYRKEHDGPPDTWQAIIPCPTTFVRGHPWYEDQWGNVWALMDTSGIAAWEYRQQSLVDISTATESDEGTFWVFGPCTWRMDTYSNDCDYLVSLHADTSGFDASRYLRLRIQWSASAATWRVRGEVNDGTGEVAGAWIDLPPLFHQPCFVWLHVRHNAGVMSYVQVGLNHTKHGFPAPILTQGASFSLGQPWRVLAMNKTSDSADRLSFTLGGVDVFKDWLV